MRRHLAGLLLQCVCKHSIILLASRQCLLDFFQFSPTLCHCRLTLLRTMSAKHSYSLNRIHWSDKDLLQVQCMNIAWQADGHACAHSAPSARREIQPR